MIDPFAATRDIYGRELEKAAPEYDGLAEHPWPCHGCANWFPFDDEPVITIVGPRVRVAQDDAPEVDTKGYVLCFCSDECAKDCGFEKAVQVRVDLYEIGGPWHVILTEDQRLPHPEKDRDLYQDIFRLRNYQISVEGPSLYALAESR